MSAGLGGVIFDMDGVLVDSHAAHRKAWHVFFETIGRDVPDSELDFILDGRKRSEILRHFLGDCRDSELEELGRRKDCIFRQAQLEIVPVPGVVAVIQELYRRGKRLALATSASRSRALSTLSELGLLSYFHVMVTGEDVTQGKPHPAVYVRASSLIEIDPACVLAVEDAISGVKSAVGAGLECVGVALHETPENLRAAGALDVVRNFELLSAGDLERILLGGPAVSARPAQLNC